MDISTAREALKNVSVGDMVRITFKATVNNGLGQILQLPHRLRCNNNEWPTLVRECVLPSRQWQGIPRVQDFTITQISSAQREVFAQIFCEIAESIERL